MTKRNKGSAYRVVVNAGDWQLEQLPADKEVTSEVLDWTSGEPIWVSSTKETKPIEELYNCPPGPAYVRKGGGNGRVFTSVDRTAMEALIRVSTDEDACKFLSVYGPWDSLANEPIGLDLGDHLEDPGALEGTSWAIPVKVWWEKSGPLRQAFWLMRVLTTDPDSFEQYVQPARILGADTLVIDWPSHLKCNYVRGGNVFQSIGLLAERRPVIFGWQYLAALVTAARPMYQDRLVYDETAGEIVRKTENEFAPLFDILWLLVWQEALNIAPPRRCVVCNKLIQEGRRSHQQTCSDACRQAKYREKKAVRNAPQA